VELEALQREAGNVWYTERLIRRVIALVAALALGAGDADRLAGQSVDGELLSGLRYRFIGPDGNRAIAVVGEPGNPLVIYVGAASGGLWKTTDGGVSWESLFDDQEASSVSALAMAPSEHNVIWAGTGETFLIRPAHAMGDGIYRSTDAGRSWQKRGLGRTGRIGRIRIDPRDSDVVFACALGHAYGPQPERGVYRTRDGGETWEHVLFVDESAGCVDLAMDPTNPRILYASFWQLQIDTWMLDSGGPHSGVWRSMDGGDTWERLSGEGRGLPGTADEPLGKVAVEVAPSEPNRVYVLTEESSPGFYRSDDHGDTWRKVLTNHTINERAPYYTRFGIDPANPDRIYFASVRFSMSVDGGKTLVDNPPRGGGDTHDVWIDPLNPDRIMVADDGGLTISLNHGRTFERVTLPIAQMYHVWVDDQVPYNVYGNRQDGWSYRGPSNSRMGAIPLGLWHDVGGCESGFSIPDPGDPDIVWSGCYDGGLEVYNHRTRHRRNVRVWPEAAYGWAPSELRFRWHWTFPIVISPHDHNTVYVGSQHVHRTRDQGHSWETVSPDLTLNDKSHQQSSGGVATDNLMTFDGAVLFALAESPLEQGLLWAGSNDGQLQLSRDGGETWTSLTARVPDLPPWGTIANIEPSRYDAGAAYISVDLHQVADFDPYIYKTTDYGESWTRVSDGIERSVHSFVHVVREDPERPGMLWAGTDNAVWMSLDDGANWNKLRINMPPAPVYWLTIQEHFDDLVVGTYGRGFYILDNIGPLRALSADVLSADHHVFDIRPAYRFQPIQGIKTERSHVTGRNPTYGADINYLLADSTQPVSIVIEGPGGDTVRSLRGTNERGINRTYWDLRYEPTRRAKLRTAPPGMPWVPLGPEGWRPLRTWDLDLNRGQLGPLVMPGTYTVRINFGESDEVTRSVEVRKDPHTEGTMDDIEAQVALSLQMRDQINEVVDMIDRLEWARKQLEDLSEMLAGDEEAEAVIAEASRLLDEAISVEGTLYDINLTGAREDAFRSAMRLYGRFSALANDLGATGADFPPTVPQKEVHEVLTDRLGETRRRFEVLMNQEVETLNAMLRERKLPVIISDLP
jgi:photosystem II stability/assembly factor-like uncharacterized protein